MKSPFNFGVPPKNAISEKNLRHRKPPANPFFLEKKKHPPLAIFIEKRGMWVMEMKKRDGEVKGLPDEDTAAVGRIEEGWVPPQENLPIMNLGKLPSKNGGFENTYEYSYGRREK